MVFRISGVPANAQFPMEFTSDTTLLFTNSGRLDISGATPLMIPFTTIVQNAFMELVRQPIFLILISSSTVFSVFLASVPYFGFGDDPKLVKDGALAVMFVAGLFGAVFNASASMSREIRSGTALAVLAKPVSRAKFLLAKFVGLAGALVLLVYANLIAGLLVSRMAFDAYGETDTFALKVFFTFIVLAYAFGGFSNYFLRRPFVSDTVFLFLLMSTLGFIYIHVFDTVDQIQSAKGQLEKVSDWRMIRASVLLLFALWILSGIALACSTRWDAIPTLTLCSAVFMLGLMSDYLLGIPAKDGSLIASFLYVVVPNWQLFWMTDALEEGKSIPLSYIGKAFLYTAAYLAASLSLALILFQDRELN
jgi:hypothetical protein